MGLRACNDIRRPRTNTRLKGDRLALVAIIIRCETGRISWKKRLCARA
jgi:hypothetical protein